MNHTLLSATIFFNPQHDKLITQGEKRETLPKTRHETMLRDKLGGFCMSYFGALSQRFI